MIVDLRVRPLRDTGRTGWRSETSVVAAQLAPKQVRASSSAGVAGGACTVSPPQMSTAGGGSGHSTAGALSTNTPDAVDEEMACRRRAGILSGCLYAWPAHCVMVDAMPASLAVLVTEMLVMVGEEWSWCMCEVVMGVLGEREACGV
eukprot:ctg_1001.g336